MWRKTLVIGPLGKCAYSLAHIQSRSSFSAITFCRPPVAIVSMLCKFGKFHEKILAVKLLIHGLLAFELS